jgi:hypothetical protein
MTHFISQSAPDIRKNLKRLENGPQTPQTEILNLAFKFIITEKNSKGLIRRGEIRPNSRCWPKLSSKTPRLPTHKARENPECLSAHVFSVALRDTGPGPVLRYATHQDHILSVNRRATGPGTAPPLLKAGGLYPLNVPPP